VEQAANAVVVTAVSRATNNLLRSTNHCFGRMCQVREGTFRNRVRSNRNVVEHFARPLHSDCANGRESACVRRRR
jgi:hypothetical protein